MILQVLYISTTSSKYIFMLFLSSSVGLEEERLLHELHDSISVGSNPAQRQKDFHINSDTTGGTLVSNVQKLTRLSLLD